MGTNIYLVKVVTESDKKSVLDKIGELIDSFSNTYGADWLTMKIEDIIKSNCGEHIHILKRSAGWQLLFQTHKDLYEDTWEGLTSFIKDRCTSGYKLIDEYGQNYSIEEMKEDFESHRNGYDIESYNKKHSINSYNHSSHEYTKDNMRWCTVDFS